MNLLLEQNERQMAQMAKSWEARLEEARMEWQQNVSDNNMQETNDWELMPHFHNINEDPQLSGIIKICFKQGIVCIKHNPSRLYLSENAV